MKLKLQDVKALKETVANKAALRMQLLPVFGRARYERVSAWLTKQFRTVPK